MQALTYFASQEQEECKSKIQEVLEHIDEHHLMPPLMVVQTLSESKCATLSDIKVKAFSSGWCGGGDLFITKSCRLLYRLTSALALVNFLQRALTSTVNGKF